MKKILTILCIAVMLAGCAVSFVACGGDGNNNQNKTQTFTFEAEYTYLDDLVGGGISNSADGVGLIVGDGEADVPKGWSSGYFVSYTYKAGLTITFEFESDKAETGKIQLRLCSELGDMNLSSNEFGVTVNDKELTYSGLFIPNSANDSFEFADYSLQESFDIKKGSNKVELLVKQNTLKDGNSTGAPLIDCIKLTTKAGLTWTPLTDNPARRSEI